MSPFWSLVLLACIVLAPAIYCVALILETSGGRRTAGPAPVQAVEPGRPPLPLSGAGAHIESIPIPPSEWGWCECGRAYDHEKWIVTTSPDVGYCSLSCVPDPPPLPRGGPGSPNG